MMEVILTTQIEDMDGIKFVRLAGPLDSVTYDNFKALLDPLVNEKGSRIVLGCESLTYVNSKGLALLGRYQRVSAQMVGFFGIAGLNKRIIRTIELLGMRKLVKLYDTSREALEDARRV